MKDRIRLKKIVSEDLESFCAMVGNEKVMAMITERALTRAEAEKKFGNMLQNSGLDPLYGSFRVVEKKSTDLIGYAKLEITWEKRDEAELGFMLLPVFWGLGLGSEIARILLDVAKSDPRLKRVYAHIDPNNEASRKILVNNGFKTEKMGELDGLSGEILALSV